MPRISGKQAAREAGVVPATVRYWCRQGWLPGATRDENGHWWVPRGALKTFLRKRGRGEKQTIEVTRFPRGMAKKERRHTA